MRNPGFLIVGGVLAGLATAHPAQSLPSCDRLDQAMAVTRSVDAQADSVEDILLGFGPSPAACSFSIDVSGSKSTNCNWVFSYRTGAADKEFNEMLAVLSACADPAFSIEADQPVNHPDFYDLRLLRIADGEVGLSLKDKVGLQQTYVFLRLTPTR